MIDIGGNIIIGGQIIIGPIAYPTIYFITQDDNFLVSQTDQTFIEEQ
jgi:predicted proteasome-type protease